MALVEALKVVWLYPVRCEHGDFCLGVLGHEVVIIREVHLGRLLLLPSLVLGYLHVLLLLGQLRVDILSVFLIVEPLLVVISLSIV